MACKNAQKRSCPFKTIPAVYIWPWYEKGILQLNPAVVTGHFWGGSSGPRSHRVTRLEDRILSTTFFRDFYSQMTGAEREITFLEDFIDGPFRCLNRNTESDMILSGGTETKLRPPRAQIHKKLTYRSSHRNIPIRLGPWSRPRSV